MTYLINELHNWEHKMRNQPQLHNYRFQITDIHYNVRKPKLNHEKVHKIFILKQCQSYKSTFWLSSGG